MKLFFRSFAFLSMFICILHLISLIAIFFRNGPFRISLLIMPVFFFLFFAGVSLCIHMLEIWTRLQNDLLLRRVALAIISVLFCQFIFFEGWILFEGIRKPPAKVDCMIVLGAGLSGKTMNRPLQLRMNTALQYLLEYPEVPVVLTGGQGPGESIPESVAMRKFLLDNNIANDRIAIETKSTSTLENFSCARHLLDENLPAENSKVLIVSNRFHIMRAKMIARRFGFSAYGLGADTPLDYAPLLYTREYLALFKSWLFDRVVSR